jgi:hypothetical protein
VMRRPFDTACQGRKSAMTATISCTLADANPHPLASVRTKAGRGGEGFSVAAGSTNKEQGAPDRSPFSGNAG